MDVILIALLLMGSGVVLQFIFGRKNGNGLFELIVGVGWGLLISVYFGGI